MIADHCFILAAGFGTRMGEVGKLLPKPIWPIFDQTLLEIQVRYALNLGFKEVFVNTFHQGSKIEEYFSNSELRNKINFVHEKDSILGVGGGIHNIAHHPKIHYSGSLLVINSDQIFFPSIEELNHGQKLLTNHQCVLFNFQPHKDELYNHLNCDKNGSVLDIVAKKDLNHLELYETYSGTCLVDLSKLTPKRGTLNFFGEIAILNETKTMRVLSNAPYVDFGTKDLYFKNCFKLWNMMDKPELSNTMKQLEMLKTFNQKDKRQGYRCDIKDVLNFSGKNLTLGGKGPAIIFDDSSQPDASPNAIIFKNQSF